MKLAVLGTGKIVQEFLPMIQQVTDVELVALLSTPRSLDKAKEMQAQYQVQEVYTDYEKLLDNDSIDTVYVALPNHLHYQYTKAALLQGKNVICEKPFTLNAQQLQELIHVLGLQPNLINPYEKMTKGEMVQNCSDKDYLLQ